MVGVLVVKSVIQDPRKELEKFLPIPKMEERNVQLPKKKVGNVTPIHVQVCN